MSWTTHIVFFMLGLRSLKSFIVQSQFTPSSDNVCVYSFAVPHWTPSSTFPSSVFSSTGISCGADKALAEFSQLLAEQQTTVKLLQQQNAALLTDQSSARQEIASSRQEIAVLLTEQTSSKQQIASLMTQMTALAQIVSSGVQTTKSNADDPPAVDNNLGNTSRTSSLCGGGVTYVRWGRTVCPNRAQVIYKGLAAGSHYQHSGGGSNYLCLPDTPEWGNKIFSTTGLGTVIYGVEYEHVNNQNEPFSWENNSGSTLTDHDAPCVVCHVPTRSPHVMIPARRNCTEGWMKEYEGYIVSQHYSYVKGQFVCLDSAPEVVAGGGLNSNGALFYAVKGSCGSLPCPTLMVGFYHVSFARNSKMRTNIKTQ